MKHSHSAPKPPFRKLKGYAFDPSLSLKMDTAEINSMTYKVIWEDKLAPGPAGEYIEVIDYDPSIKKYYTPVDLNDPYLLAQDGLDATEGNPQFHQQMVYAVAMTTIKNFERALGRRILWAPRLLQQKDPKNPYDEFVGKLRIYPHALREANAFYSPQKKAILFGYFSATPADRVVQMPGSLVFTCLSHDIIAHETTHAILDGLNYYYNDPTNPDVLAFHEAFADIVALFQHFSFPEVLKHQIAETKGDLGSQNMLGKLAQEFGTAIGSYGSLRDAIGTIDENTKEWKPAIPDSNDYLTLMEPHSRGAILVAAVFEAFIAIYKRRVADLLRIASGGSGILPQGELHPDLVNRLASEASKAAAQVLNMCIRAIDYCPPVDITFGEYLRAIITADHDVMPEDPKHYRLSFIDAFRRRGIYPEGIKTLSEESLRFECQPEVKKDTQKLFNEIFDMLEKYRNLVIHENDRYKIYSKEKEVLGGDPSNPDSKSLHKAIYNDFQENQDIEKLTGIVLNKNWSSYGVRTSPTYGNGPSVRVQNLRVMTRTGPEGKMVNQIAFCIVQRCGVSVVNGEFRKTYVPGKDKIPDGGFEFFGGCTLIFDLDSLELRYAIAKPIIKVNQKAKMELDTQRILKQYNYQYGEGVENLTEHQLYFYGGLINNFNEPFAFLHTH